MMVKTMKKTLKISLILVALVTVAMVLITVFFALNHGWWTSPETPAVEAILKNPGYIPDSRLYLVSANASYGLFNGQACFIINATIRSDYSAENPPPNGNSNSTTAYFAITAILYHHDAIVPATDVGGASIPPLGVPLHALKQNETETFEIFMATSARNIDSYAITCMAVANSPRP